MCVKVELMSWPMTRGRGEVVRLIQSEDACRQRVIYGPSRELFPRRLENPPQVANSILPQSWSPWNSRQLPNRRRYLIEFRFYSENWLLPFRLGFCFTSETTVAFVSLPPPLRSLDMVLFSKWLEVRQIQDNLIYLIDIALFESWVNNLCEDDHYYYYYYYYYHHHLYTPCLQGVLST